MNEGHAIRAATFEDTPRLLETLVRAFDADPIMRWFIREDGRRLEGHEIFLEKRETFYGATEIGFREPGGHYVVVAQFAANSPEEA